MTGSTKTRTRLSREQRRRQLVGIGLRKLVERPIQEVSIDEVATEAGISRGLLFHYFPSKAAFHEAVVAAAGRRVLRNVTPDEGVDVESALRQVVERYVAQIDRRRASYLALLYGQRSSGVDDLAGTLRTALAQKVIDVLGLGANCRPVVHGWVAYVEDRALTWSAVPVGERAEDLDDLVGHCTHALHALLDEGGPTS